MGSPKLTAAFAIVICLLVAANAGFHEWSRRNFEESLPAKFEITDTLFSYEELGCGLAIFKLSDVTVSRINTEKLDFFQNATVARVAHTHGYNSYLQWNRTPVPKSWYSEGSWFACGEHKLLRSIVDAGINSGAYYTTTNTNEAKLIVAPSLGVIVYSFFD